MAVVSLAGKLAQFDEHWTPKIVATYNDNDIMVVKLKGEFAGIRTPRPTTCSWC